jgi:hypothetical protein
VSRAELQVGDTAEVILIAGQEDAPVGQTDTGDQVVNHADTLPLRLDRAAYFCRALARVGCQAKHGQRGEQARHLVLLGGTLRAAEQLKAVDGGRGQVPSLDLQLDSPGPRGQADYENALARELAARDIRFERLLAVPILYRGSEVGLHRLDLELRQARARNQARHCHPTAIPCLPGFLRGPLFCQAPQPLPHAEHLISVM